MLPDFHFTNELGKAVRLSQYKGQVLAFTFFYTACPFPNFCPRMTGNFAEAAAQLQSHAWRADPVAFAFDFIRSPKRHPPTVPSVHQRRALRSQPMEFSHRRDGADYRVGRFIRGALLD